MAKNNSNLSLKFTDFHHKAKQNKKDYFIFHINYFNMGIKSLDIFKLCVIDRMFRKGYQKKVRQSKKDCKDKHIEDSGIEREDYNPHYNEANILNKRDNEYADTDEYDSDADPKDYVPQAIRTEEAVRLYKKYNPNNSLNISYMKKGQSSKLAKIKEEIEFFDVPKGGRWLYVPKDILANVRSVSELFVVGLMLNYKPAGGDWTLTDLRRHLNNFVTKQEVKGIATGEDSLCRFLKKYRAYMRGKGVEKGNWEGSYLEKPKNAHVRLVYREVDVS